MLAAMIDGWVLWLLLVGLAVGAAAGAGYMASKKLKEADEEDS